MIIVEGMDNSGKTTLCEKLESKSNFPVIHSPGPPQVVGIEAWFSFVRDTLTREVPCIYDRHPIFSEYIYGPLLRGVNMLSDKDYLSKLVKKDPLVIYCRPADSIIVDFKDTIQMNGVKEKALMLIKAYDDFMNLFRANGRVYDYDYNLDPTDEKVMEVFNSYCLEKM